MAGDPGDIDSPPMDGDAGDRRVRPISFSIFSRRSIAFCICVALVARRNVAIVSAASASICLMHCSAFSDRVPTPCSVTGSSACSSRSMLPDSLPVSHPEHPATYSTPSGCDRMSPLSVASACGSAGRAHASTHASLALSKSRAPGALNATSNRYPVTARSAPFSCKALLSLVPLASPSPGIPSTTNAQHRSSSASVSAPANPAASESRSRSLATDAAT